jgi:hypothetical protein
MKMSSPAGPRPSARRAPQNLDMADDDPLELGSVTKSKG